MCLILFLESNYTKLKVLQKIIKITGKKEFKARTVPLNAFKCSKYYLIESKAFFCFGIQEFLETLEWAQEKYYVNDNL